MTLSVSWVRSVGSIQELLFASDSRLRAGQAWDCCPKILTLSRSDCLISFAGETDYAYPLMLQMARAIEFYPASFDRRVDISIVKDQAINIFNQMRALIHDFPDRQTTAGDPQTGFLFGGYSWREQRFLIWQLTYSPQIDAFRFRLVPNWRGQSGTKIVAFAGDATKDAHTRLVALLREREKLSSGNLDMEPFEVLRDMIRSSAYPTIGGAPQVAKVYRYLKTQYFAVRWPTGKDIPHVLGRPALNYERFEVPSLDPDAPEVQARWQIVRRAKTTIDRPFLTEDYEVDDDWHADKDGETLTVASDGSD